MSLNQPLSTLAKDKDKLPASNDLLEDGEISSKELDRLAPDPKF